MTDKTPSEQIRQMISHLTLIYESLRGGSEIDAAASLEIAIDRIESIAEELEAREKLDRALED